MSPLSLTRRTTFNESLKHLSCRLLVHRVIMLEGQEEIGDCTYDVLDTKEMLRKKKERNAQTTLHVSLRCPGCHHDMVGVS